MFITKITYNIREVAEFFLNSETKPLITIKYDQGRVTKVTMDAEITDFYELDPHFKNEVDKAINNQTKGELNDI